MMKQVRHLFWDFDGTLFDSYPELSGSFMKGLKELLEYPKRTITLLKMSRCLLRE